MCQNYDRSNFVLLNLIVYTITCFNTCVSDLVKETCILDKKWYSKRHDTHVCHINQQWFVFGMREWKFAHNQLLINHFPIDPESRNFARQVKDALFSVAYPTPLTMKPVLAAAADDVLMDLLNIDPEQKTTDRFLKFANGEQTRDSVLPLAHR